MEKIVHKYEIDKYTINELKREGLTIKGIKAFADQIMQRYFSTEYLDFDDVRELNDE